MTWDDAAQWVSDLAARMQHEPALRAAVAYLFVLVLAAAIGAGLVMGEARRRIMLLGRRKPMTEQEQREAEQPTDGHQAMGPVGFHDTTQREVYAPEQPQEYVPNPVTDSGVHARLDSTQAVDSVHFGHRRECRACGGVGKKVCQTCGNPVDEPCQACGGKGFLPSVADLLQESAALVAPEEADGAVREFYARAFAGDQERDLMDQLAPLFHPDLIRAAAGQDGAEQRDVLWKALAKLATTYDPADPVAMDQLRREAEIWGRRHALFERPAGPPRGATLREYGKVLDLLLSVLHDLGGDNWTVEYDLAWEEAYDVVAAEMLKAAHDAVISGAVQFPRTRRLPKSQ